LMSDDNGGPARSVDSPDGFDGAGVEMDLLETGGIPDVSVKSPVPVQEDNPSLAHSF
jgi:hypothetical protein